jgi:site-specific DNA-adenine methylase
LDTINELVKGKQYDEVIDVFMGSGNLILNVDCQANKYIGNDKTKLIPKLYTEIPKYKYTLEELEVIINQFNRFSEKDDYYKFREYWNQKYADNKFDKAFMYETILLLKMCSNSMIRFNHEGVFNQGFRGLGKSKEFFADSMKKLCVDGLNNLSDTLKSRPYEFVISDFLNLPHKDLYGEDNLLLIDPPYILQQNMYTQDFSQKHDECLLDILHNTKSDFVYFNYLNRDGQDNDNLINITKQFNTIHINNKTASGQGRSQGSRQVEEVIITNIRP